MDELMNLMIADESPSEISDSIKTQLMQKATARIDALKKPKRKSKWHINL
jgi:hypothetical protein